MATSTVAAVDERGADLAHLLPRRRRRLDEVGVVEEADVLDRQRQTHQRAVVGETLERRRQVLARLVPDVQRGDSAVLHQRTEVVVRNDGEVRPVAFDAEQHLVAQLGEVDGLDGDADAELLFELGAELGEDRDAALVVDPEGQRSLSMAPSTAPPPVATVTASAAAMAPIRLVVRLVMVVSFPDWWLVGISFRSSPTLYRHDDGIVRAWLGRRRRRGRRPDRDRRSSPSRRRRCRRRRRGTPTSPWCHHRRRRAISTRPVNVLVVPGAVAPDAHRRRDVTRRRGRRSTRVSRSSSGRSSSAKS